MLLAESSFSIIMFEQDKANQEQLRRSCQSIQCPILWDRA